MAEMKTKSAMVVDGVTVREVTDYGDEQISQFLIMIDEAAGQLRELLVSRGTGQELVYMKKQQEAILCKHDLAPSGSDYPFLDVDARRAGITLHQAADEVMRRAKIFEIVGATIEELKFEAKDALKTEREGTAVWSAVNSVSLANLTTKLIAKGFDISSIQ